MNAAAVAERPMSEQTVYGALCALCDTRRGWDMPGNLPKENELDTRLGGVLVGRAPRTGSGSSL